MPTARQIRRRMRLVVALILCGITTLAWGQTAAPETRYFFTGVFAGDKSSGVIVSWKLLTDGTMTGQWQTNGGAASIEVRGRYLKDGAELSFLIESKVRLSSGDPVSIRIIGTGAVRGPSAQGRFTLFSEDQRLANDDGTWAVVNGYSDDENLTLEKRPAAAAARPTQSSVRQQEEVQEIRHAFLPGVSGSIISPFQNGLLYSGGNFHYAFIQGISTSQNSSDFGGYYEWYTEIGYFKEQQSGPSDDIFFTYALGVNLSFEKFLNSYRSILVPYFGAKGGGIYFNRLSGGLFLEPILGVVVIQTKGFNVNYDAGLFLNTVNLTDFIGVHHSLIVNFNL